MEYPLQELFDYPSQDVASSCTVETLLMCVEMATDEDADWPDGRPGKWLREFAGLSNQWLGHLHRYGVTKKLAEELNGYLAKFETPTWMQINVNTGLVEWRYSEFDPGDYGGGDAAAYHFAWLLSTGELDGLNRCQLPECKKFFVGTKRKQWCSNACGTKYRIRKKRKLDKERQML